MGKNKIQNERSFATSIKLLSHVVKIVKMDNEELNGKAIKKNWKDL
jgi:hypothetical protein